MCVNNTCCVLRQISGLKFSVLISYFIGYFDGIRNKPIDPSKFKFGLEALAFYDLAKPPSDEWLDRENWNGDTTGWEM